ncbi:MAG TPA: hypothetical protein PK286_02895 [Devosia sp.]|nr:hypothetical protein [Devosia sp.]
MKTLLVTAFAASVLFCGPGAFVTSGSALAQGACSPGAPEAWFRPGGFCAQIGAGNSLSGPADPGCTPHGPPVLEEEVLVRLVPVKGARVNVAEWCARDSHCDDLKLTSMELKVGDRLRTADLVECQI